MYANGRALRGLTHSYANAGVAAGTTTTTTTTANTAATINGKWGTPYASASNAATPTTDANSGAAFTAVTPGYGCALVFGVNAAGTLKLAQGPQVLLTPGSSATTSGAFNDAPQFPPLPDDFAPLAYALIRTATGSAAWTPGSSNWTATGLTATFVNTASLPDRPQTS